MARHSYSELQDAVVLGAANDVETLTAGLAGKIWKKLMSLDAAAPPTDAAAREDLCRLGEEP